MQLDFSPAVKNRISPLAAKRWNVSFTPQFDREPFCAAVG